MEFSWQVIEIVTKHFKNTMQRDYLQEKRWLQQSLPMDQIVIYKININKLQFFDQTKNTTYFLFLIIIKLKFIINHFFLKKLWQNAAQCCTVRHSATSCSIVRHFFFLFSNEVRHLAAPCGIVRHCAALCRTFFRHLTTRCRTVLHFFLHLATRCGTVRHTL